MEKYKNKLTNFELLVCCKYFKSVRLAEKSLECVRDVAHWLMALHCTPERLEELKKELKEGSNDQGRNQTT